MTNKGVSTVITVILLTALGVVLVGILAVALRNVVEREVDVLESCAGLDDSVVLGPAYSCYSSLGDLQFALILKNEELDTVKLTVSKGNDYENFEFSSGEKSSNVENYLWGDDNSGLEFPAKTNPKMYVIRSDFFTGSSISEDYSIQVAPVVNNHVCDIINKVILRSCYNPGDEFTCSNQYLGYRCTSNLSNCIEDMVAPSSYECTEEYCCKRKYPTGEVLFNITACGDGTCQEGETCLSCEVDCGVCCGDGFCNSSIGETCTNCSTDCGLCSLGQVCDENSDCASGYCYIDSDGDRYANATGTKICQSVSLLSAQTDCYDLNANAYPWQTSYFSNHRGDGSFDYDCDTVEYPLNEKCVNWLSVELIDTCYWYDCQSIDPYHVQWWDSWEGDTEFANCGSLYSQYCPNIIKGYLSATYGDYCGYGGSNDLYCGTPESGYCPYNGEFGITGTNGIQPKGTQICECK